MASSMVSRCFNLGPLIQIHYDYMECPNHVDWTAFQGKSENRKGTVSASRGRLKESFAVRAMRFDLSYAVKYKLQWPEWTRRIPARRDKRFCESGIGG